jgi:hypothetical protein
MYNWTVHPPITIKIFSTCACDTLTHCWTAELFVYTVQQQWTKTIKTPKLNVVFTGVHKNDNFFGSEFEFWKITVLVMLKY